MNRLVSKIAEIDSGEIVVSTIGNDLYVDYTVVGQTAHLASRMEQMAMPGSVLATADTYRLVEGYVEVKPLGLVPVKGLAKAYGSLTVLDADIKNVTYHFADQATISLSGRALHLFKE